MPALRVTFHGGRKARPGSTPGCGRCSNQLLAKLLTLNEEMIAQHEKAAALLRAQLRRKAAPRSTAVCAKVPGSPTVRAGRMRAQALTNIGV